jgi:hypothetical protein
MENTLGTAAILPVCHHKRLVRKQVQGKDTVLLFVGWLYKATNTIWTCATREMSRQV